MNVSRWRFTAGLMVVVGATCFTALLSLALEDLDWSPAKLSAQMADHSLRWVFLIIFAVVLLVGYGLSRWLEADHGTFYYIRILAESFPDMHLPAAREAAANSLGYRSITRWFDPGTRTVDVRRITAEASAEFERATNDDDDRTGFDVAPNMMFPAALGLGYDWAPPPTTVLREYVNDALQFRFELGCARSTGSWRCDQHCTSDSLRAKSKPAFPTHFVRHPPLEQGPQVERRRIVTGSTPSESGPAPQIVWLNIHLSDRADRVVLPDWIRADVALKVGIFVVPGTASTDARTRQVMATALPPRRNPKKLAGSDLVCIHPRVLAEAAAYWIIDTAQSYPMDTIVLTAQMPKAVSLTAGWLLADARTKPGRDAPGYRYEHIWRRLVPLGYFEGERNDDSRPAPMRPMWVRYDQTDPDILLGKAGCVQ